MDNKDKIILHLCASEYGSDTKDYRDAGYDVRLITKDVDVRKYNPPTNVYGIIANPPCTMFSIARGTNAKKSRDLEEGMILVKECLRIIWQCNYAMPDQNKFQPQLKFWVIENPATGFLKWFLGKPAFTYTPYDFGDNYSKRTALWGQFNAPIKPFFANQKSKEGMNMKDLHWEERDREKRTDLRSIASPFFTKAFFQANP